MSAPLPAPSAALHWRQDVPLAAHTSMQIGGNARHWLEVDSLDACRLGLAEARRQRWPLLILGGGSNVVVADAGFAGLVLRPLAMGIQQGPQVAGRVRLSVGAGVPWDTAVEAAVARGLAGLECLSGIPGLTGAVAVQNVGAYGQEVGTTLVSAT